MSERRPVLDLSQTLFADRVGPIVVLGTWYHHPGPGQQSEPCLVVLSARRSPTKTWRALGYLPAILMRDLWRWHEDTADAHDLDALLKGLAPDVGLDPLLIRDRHTLLTAIRGRLSDLFAMPPAPERPRVAVGEITMRIDDGETVIHDEITRAA